MKTLTKKILENTLSGTCLYPKYPSGDLKESHKTYPFVDSSITDEQFKAEAERFNPLKSFWEVLDYSNLENLKNKSKIFVMHPFTQKIIKPSQLAIPLETLMYLNHKQTIQNLNTNPQTIFQKVLKENELETYLQSLPNSSIDKLVIKTPYSAAGDGVSIYDKTNQTDSLEKINQLIQLSKSRNNSTYLIQEYLEGKDLSLQGFITKSGETFYVGNGIQEIGAHGEYDGLKVSKSSPTDKYISLLQNAGNIASKKGFYGFFGLDLKETNSGQLNIIDPNFRPTDGTPKYLKELRII
jgi:hypothetical protein